MEEAQILRLMIRKIDPRRGFSALSPTLELLTKARASRMGNDESNLGPRKSFPRRFVSRLENLKSFDGKADGELSESYTNISLQDFVHPGKDVVCKIGQGGFGKVVAMRKRETQKYFAVKSFHKGKLIARREVDQALNELTLLMRLPHNHFVVNLFYAFQDKDRLYMCTNLMLGGSLQNALSRLPSNKMSLEGTRVLAAELVLAVEFLHANRIVHRDVKPDNILLDHTGHMRLTDFNISITISEEEEADAYHRDGWGTRGYRAPEIYLRKGKGLMFACDWWSVGAVVYVLLTGKLPYSKKREEESNVSLVTRMRAEEFNRERVRDENARGLCEELLRYKPEDRIGCSSGPKSEVLIMTHPFFESIDWDKYESGAFLNSHIESLPEEESKYQAISQYAGKTNSVLDDNEVLRCFQQSLGVADMSADDSDQFPSILERDQVLFEDWIFNVDFILEQNSKPKFTLVHTVSSMSPEEIRQYVLNASVENLKALSDEIKQYKEQAMLENYQHVKAEIRNEQLLQQNLKLNQEIAAYKKQLEEVGVVPSLDTLKIPSPAGQNPLMRQRSNDTEQVMDDKGLVTAYMEQSSNAENWNPNWTQTETEPPEGGPTDHEESSENATENSEDFSPQAAEGVEDDLNSGNGDDERTAPDEEEEEAVETEATTEQDVSKESAAPVGSETEDDDDDDDDDDFQDVLSEEEYLQTQLLEEETANDASTIATTTLQPSVVEDKQKADEASVQEKESPSSAESASLRRRSNDHNKILDISSLPGDDIVQFDSHLLGSTANKLESESTDGDVTEEVEDQHV